MRRLSIVLFLLALVTGCASTSGTQDDIPEGAKEIRVFSEEQPDAMFDILRRHLAAHDYEMEEEDDGDRTLETGFRDVGQGTQLKVRAEVQEAADGSVTVLHAHWASLGDSEAVEQAAWYPRDASSFAFGELVDIAKALPGSLDYVTQ